MVIFFEGIEIEFFGLEDLVDFFEILENDSQLQSRQKYPHKD